MRIRSSEEYVARALDDRSITDGWCRRCPGRDGRHRAWSAPDQKIAITKYGIAK
jgi:hypothetical protein